MFQTLESFANIILTIAILLSWAPMVISGKNSWAPMPLWLCPVTPFIYQVCRMATSGSYWALSVDRFLTLKGHGPTFLTKYKVVSFIGIKWILCLMINLAELFSYHVEDSQCTDTSKTSFMWPIYKISQIAIQFPVFTISAVYLYILAYKHLKKAFPTSSQPGSENFVWYVVAASSDVMTTVSEIAIPPWAYHIEYALELFSAILSSVFAEILESGMSRPTT
ncbi:7 transmembrane receptor (rhodopsin family) domain-containing protein [Ditylenchus destructor]|nr:7 transmembrane receptor (rhodopsin family) domain-containing protein [Ditylenchus destructor]